MTTAILTTWAVLLTIVVGCYVRRGLTRKPDPYVGPEPFTGRPPRNPDADLSRVPHPGKRERVTTTIQFGRLVQS